MPVGDGCQVGGASITWSNQQFNVVAVDEVHVLNRAPTATSVRGAIEYNTGGALLTGFIAEIWLVSGPGPVYTNEVRLGQLLGAQPIGTTVGGNWLLSTVMPVSGRVWDWTRDGFRGTFNTGYTTSSSTPLTMFFAGCSAAATVTDCCAELNAKLDQLLAFTGKVFVNQP